MIRLSPWSHGIRFQSLVVWTIVIVNDGVLFDVVVVVFANVDEVCDINCAVVN